MLNITYGLDEDDRFEGIMKGRRNHIPGSNQDVFEDSKGNLISEYRYFRMTKEFDEMMKDADFDILHICTPHYLHYSMIVKALDAGKKVVCEKPIVMKEEEFTKLLAHPKCDDVCV